jgi:septal ring factor EnvC (AmiA/AmiB activator)
MLKADSPKPKSENAMFKFPNDTPEFKLKLKKCDPEIRERINDWRKYLIEILKIKEMFKSENIKLKAKVVSLQLDIKSIEKELNECRALQEKFEKDIIERAEHEASKRDISRYLIRRLPKKDKF